MILSHKIRLNPTEDQEAYLWKAAHNARFVYNWGLATWTEMYKSGEKVSLFSLDKYLNSIKRDECPWVRETCATICQYALKDLNTAFQKFFNEPGTGYPKFKSRHKAKPSFGLSNQKFRVDGHWLKISKVKTLINMTEPLRFNGKIMSARFSYSSNYWWVSFAVEMPFDYEHNGGSAVGVDLGLKSLVVTSDGEIFENQRNLNKHLKKLKKLQRKLSRQQKGSNRRQKTKEKIAKVHYRISCLRKDYINKITTYLTTAYGFIGVETLNAKGMMKNRRLAKSIGDASLYEIVRQLEYKAEIYGSFVQKIDMWFPSTKLCSNCQYKNDDLTLSDREWQCPNCGVWLDRDINAAINIEKESIRVFHA